LGRIRVSFINMVFYGTASMFDGISKKNLICHFSFRHVGEFLAAVERYIQTKALQDTVQYWSTRSVHSDISSAFQGEVQRMK
jgi:hypothetical protein